MRLLAIQEPPHDGLTAGGGSEGVKIWMDKMWTSDGLTGRIKWYDCECL